MIKLIPLFLLFIIPKISFSQDTWTQMDSVNGPPRSSCSHFVLNGEGFVVGGLDVTEFKRKMYSYDVDQDDWDAEESLGGINGSGLNRGSAIGFEAAGKGYIGLGQGNGVSYLSDIWCYNPDNETWTQKADFIGSPRRQAVAFSIDSIAYVGTGQDQDGFTNDFYKYDPILNIWDTISDFAGTARKGAVGFAMGAQGYVGTGDDGVYTNDFWQYQPLTDTWIQKANFPGNARTGASGWGIFPTAFIACGHDNTWTYRKDVWEYNYFGDVWTQRAELNGPGRSNASAFVIKGIGYLGLGYNGQFLDDFFAYTPMLSLEQSNKQQNINAYPNPTNGTVYIELNSNLLDKSTVKIYDLQGKNMSNLIDISNNTNTTILQLTNLPKGIYICKINTPSQSYFQKITLK